MQNTWMVRTYSMQFIIFSECIFYLKFLLKFKRFHLFLRNWSSTMLFKFNFIKGKVNPLNNLSNSSHPQIPMYPYSNNLFALHTNSHSQKKELACYKIASSKDKYLISQKNNTYNKIFSLFFLFNFSLFNNQFKAHPGSKLFYIKYLNKDIFIIDTKNFFLRWKDSLDLFFNIFYYKFNPIIFGSPYFKNELLALNWSYTQFDINLWKYYYPFLIFKQNKYNPKTLYYFSKLAASDIDFYFITDCAYHHRILYYIRKKKLYSIGLVNTNMNPWVVSYPILGFFDSYVTQFFFLKIIIAEERKARISRYVYFYNIWFFFANRLSRLV